MASRLRVGMIGTGFGSLVQIPAFRAHARAEVVAVASGTPGKAKKTAEALGVLSRLRRLAEARSPADLDLVSITTPPSLHHAMALARSPRAGTSSARSRWRCRPSEAEDMLAHGDRAKRVHLIDHELRFNPNRRKARRLIEDGFIGVPRHALLTVVNPGAARPREALGVVVRRVAGRRTPGRGRSHQVDLLRYWLGDIAAVTGTTVRVRPERPAARRSGRRRVTADDLDLLAPLPLGGDRHGGAQRAVATHNGRAARRGLGRSGDRSF